MWGEATPTSRQPYSTLMKSKTWPYQMYQHVSHKFTCSGIGEIATRGRNVFLGYMWDEEKTREVVTAEGWVLSGDLGRQDEDGFFYVCGRMKEILITGGGENVSPVPIEDDIKAGLGEVVSQAVVVGDQRKHLAVLLTLRTELDAMGQPTDTLHPQVGYFCAI